MSLLSDVLRDLQITEHDCLELYKKAQGVQEVYHDKLAKSLRCLSDNGIIPKEEGIKLYQAVIHVPYDADNLAAAFVALSKAGADPDSHANLYELVVKNGIKADELAKSFKILTKSGFNANTHTKLYEDLADKPRKAVLLANALALLDKNKLSYATHRKLYRVVLSRESPTNKVAEVFVALATAGISLNSNENLYHEAIRSGASIDKMKAALIALTEANITFQDQPKLYEAILHNNYYATSLSAAFIALSKAGATDSNKSLYEAVIKFPGSADELATVWAALSSAGIRVNTHPSLFEGLIKNKSNLKGIPHAIEALSKANIKFDMHPTLYSTVINKTLVADRIPGAFSILSDANITFDEHPEIYKLVIEKINSEDFQQCLSIMQKLNLSANDHFPIIEMILNSNPGVSLDIAQWLQKHQLNIESHEYIYKLLFLGTAPLIKSPYQFNKLRLAVDSYFESHECLSNEDEAYAEQCFDIQSIINLIMQDEKSISEGPLNKSKETLQIEMLLKRLCNEPVDNINIRFDDSFGYILQFKNESDIYLSELLRLANFNHLELTDKLIEDMGARLEAIAPDFKLKAPLDNNAIIKKLPEQARQALRHYIGDKHYLNINRLFRGVYQNNEAKYTWISPVEDTPNLLANLLTGCLVNWSAAELPRILIDLPERRLLERIFLDTESSSKEVANAMKGNEAAYHSLLSVRLASGTITEEEYQQAKDLFDDLNVLFPSYGIIDRGENISRATQDGELALKERRIANPIHTPSVTSLSVYEEGSDYFHQEGTERTKFETDYSNLTIVNREEGEILTPAGTSYQYTSNPNGGFFAREVNSPSVQSKQRIWSSTAIAEAYRNHLKNPYQDSYNHTTVNGTTIQRPNHGLAHEYRVMSYLDVVIDYFAHHAADETFQLFCQHITPEEREWLRVAAAYSITGRESEISAGENLVRYNEFREACQTHMSAFIESHPPSSNSSDMRNRMLHIVRWMGNPAYENDFESNPAINTDSNIDERAHRNFIHRILTIAHKLDLVRCYKPQQFEEAMTKCLLLSNDSKPQQSDYNRMIQYAVDLNRAHGNALETDITPSGRLTDCNETYRAPFDKASTSIRQVRELTESVSRPQLSEQYQFSSCEDEELKSRVLKMCGLPYDLPESSFKPK